MFETRQALKGVGWIIGCVLSVCLHTSMAVAQCVPPPSGLLAWWDADSVTGTTAFDIQDANDGTLVNGASTVPGFVGQAFSFDGVDDYVIVSDDPSLDFNAQDISVELWYNLNSLPTIGYTLLDKRDGSNEGYNLFYSVAVGQWRWTVEEAVSGDFCQAQFSATPTTNQWVHLAVTYDASAGRCKLYENGVLKADTSFSMNPANIDARNDLDLTIGSNGGLDSFVDGLIDEVEIYSRALSASEIQDIFNAGSAGKCKDADGDGVNDADDECPDSDLSDTIVINGVDTGVDNELVGDGCSLSDLIAQLLANDASTADIVQFLVDLKGDGIISGQEMGAILKALNSP